jgi:hypothetical protein
MSGGVSACSFFLIEERRQSSSIFRTIAHQLGSFDGRIGTAIAKTIDTTSNITQMAVVRQFTHLVVNPLLSHPKSETPIVIVLDALDECGNANSREDFLATLVAKFINLPPAIRIIIGTGYSDCVHGPTTYTCARVGPFHPP